MIIVFWHVPDPRLKDHQIVSMALILIRQLVSEQNKITYSDADNVRLTNACIVIIFYYKLINFTMTPIMANASYSSIIKHINLSMCQR